MKGMSEFPAFVSQFEEAHVPLEGVKARMMRDSRSQVVFIEFAEAVSVPEHSHKEQWEFVLSGSVRLNRAGEEAEFSAGDNFFIPAGVAHSAKVSDGYRALIIFNEPNRYEPR